MTFEDPQALESQRPSQHTQTSAKLGIEWAEDKHQESSKKHSFAVLFGVMLVIASGNTALQSVLPSIGRDLRMPDILVASIFSLSALLWTITAPFWARQAQSRGRKALILLGLYGFIISMIASGLVLEAGFWHMLTPLGVVCAFLLTRAVFGVLGSAASPAAQAYVASNTQMQERTNALALLSSAFGLGTILGPAFAPFFVYWFGLTGPLYAFGVLALAVAWCVQRWLASDAPSHTPSAKEALAAARQDKARPAIWRDQRVQPFLVYGFVIGSVQAMVLSVLGFVIIDQLRLPPDKAQPFVGVAVMAGAGATLLAQWGLMRMVALSPPVLMALGTFGASFGLALAAIAPDYGGLVIAFGVMSFGFGLGRPGFTAGASLIVGAEEQDRVAGAVTAANGACYIVAPAAGIALYHTWAPAPFVVGCLLMLGLFIHAWCHRTLRSTQAFNQAVGQNYD
jgi:MFS family permease